MCWRHTWGCRAGWVRRGELVTHVTRFAGVIFSLSGVPPCTRPAKARAPLFSLSTLLRSAAHRKTQTGTMRNRVALLANCFSFQSAAAAPGNNHIRSLCLGRAKPRRPCKPRSCFGARPCLCISIPRGAQTPIRRATPHHSGGCSSCSHIVSWGVGMIPATMHPVSSCCA